MHSPRKNKYSLCIITEAETLNLVGMNALELEGEDSAKEMYAVS